MNYGQLYAQKKVAGELVSLTPVFKKWEMDKSDNPPVVIGEFISKSEVMKKGEAQGYNNYIFKTDDGPISFNLGKHVEEKLDSEFIVGAIYSVEYTGKKDLGDGKRLNMFEIFKLADSVEEADNIAPVEEKGKEDGNRGKKKD